jgi:putative DNA primase/helicase
MPRLSPKDAEGCQRKRGPGLAASGLADILSRQGHFAQDTGGGLYLFEHGAYRSGAEKPIRLQVKTLLKVVSLDKKWSSHIAEEVIAYIRADAPSLWERPPLDRVNVLNGILDVHTRQLSPHAPEFMSPVQLQVRYDPHATCPAWEKFVCDVLPPDAHAIAYEIPAWLMVPYTGIQKAVLLQGAGCNGKSTYLRAVVAFLGPDNVSTVSLHKLETDRFGTSRLIGKLANICPDLPNKKLDTTSVFKAITGGDPLMAERKFHDSFDFRPFARLVFAVNEMPSSADASDGFYRRLIIVPFERTFNEDPEQGVRLDAALASPEELSGLLNKALGVLPRLLKQGIPISPSMAEAQAEYRALTDPLEVFLDTETVEDPEGWMPKAALYGAYAEQWRMKGQVAMTKAAFGRRLKSLREGLRDTQQVYEGKVTWGYSGIRFAESSIHTLH